MVPSPPYLLSALSMLHWHKNPWSAESLHWILNNFEVIKWIWSSKLLGLCISLILIHHLLTTKCEIIWILTVGLRDSWVSPTHLTHSYVCTVGHLPICHVSKARLYIITAEKQRLINLNESCILFYVIKDAAKSNKWLHENDLIIACT